MDLRTKLVFSLVAAALLGMAALGATAYATSEAFLTERSLRHLDSLAQLQESRVRTVVVGWKESASLVASRTQLRASMGELAATGGDAEVETIRRILDDAERASERVLAVAVYDLDGRVVAWAGEFPDLEAPLSESLAEALGDTIFFEGIFENAAAAVRLLAPLDVDGDRVGVLRIWLSTADLTELAADYSGLGDTGETLVVVAGPDGEPRLLTPTRHGENEAGSPLAGDRDEPTRRALQGEEGASAQRFVDYRGEEVWAATRYLPEVGWGLVVKVDAAEERAPVMELRSRLTGVGLSLSAFAILAGTLLGLRFAAPIRQLASVADRMREGELDARAPAGRDDELGLLARSFNEMGDELERRMTLLQEYKRFFDVSRDLLCIAGTDGYFKRINPAFERSLGWKAEDLLGRPFVEFVHPDDVEKTLRETERLAQGFPTVSFENRYRLPDGRYEVLRWTCHPDRETDFLYAIARLASAEDGAV